MAQFLNIFKENPKRRFLIIGVSAFTIMLIIVLFSDYGLVNRFKLGYEKNKLQEEIVMQKKIKDSLQNQIRLLQNDSLTIEKIAREKYGMKKRNEEIIIINDTTKTD